MQELDAVMIPFPDAEKQELLRHLKTRWGVQNSAFQKLPLQLDTATKKRRKEQLELELTQTEADIQLLQLRPGIMIV